LRLIDRVLVVVIALVLIGVITVVAIAPDAIIRVLAGIEEASLLLRLAVVVVLNIVILIALYLGLRGPRREIIGLEVRAPGAYTDISIESARKLILHAVENVPDVVSASATVKAVNGRADVDLNVQVAGDNIHVPNKQKEISRALRQVINKQLGLRMRGQPRVHIFLQDEQSHLPAPEAAVTAVEEAAAPVQPEAVQPESSVPDSQMEVTSAADDDTVLKDEQPKDEKKPSLLANILPGQKDDDQKEAERAEEEENESTGED